MDSDAKIEQGVAYQNLYMRYLGVLGLLGDASVHVDDRELTIGIETAMADASNNHEGIRWRRIMNRREIVTEMDRCYATAYTGHPEAAI